MPLQPHSFSIIRVIPRHFGLYFGTDYDATDELPSRVLLIPLPLARK